MKNKNDLFAKPKKTKKHNPNLKYFIIAFSLLIVIVAVASAFLFMRSIDFDFSNLVDRSTTETVTEENEVQNTEYSVAELIGNSQILLLITDSSKKADFGFIISTDFSGKSMTVRSFDAQSVLSDGKTYEAIYNESFISGLKSRINSEYSASITKYIVCTPSQFKKIISSFGGVTVNIAENVNYKSDEFNVTLEKGTQKLSDEYAYKYLAISSNSDKARIICNIINSIFVPENSEKQDDLFSKFVNNCDTDISVVDYSNAADTIKIYSNASDKFYPTVIA